MSYSFKARIYKVGINPCVDVPLPVTDKMKVSKGYIPITGEINGYSFQQTLVPVKNEPYRLYVNGIMLKGSGTTVGDEVKFVIEKDDEPKIFPMPKELSRQLKANGLGAAFKKLTPYRQKEILRYLGFLKTEEAVLRNINKVIDQLKKNST